MSDQSKRVSELAADLEAAGFGFMLSCKETASALQLDEKTVRKLVADRQLRASHVGLQRPKIRVTRKEVARFITICEDSGDE